MDGWDGFWVKIDPKVTKTIKIDTSLLGIVVFSWKKTAGGPRCGNLILALAWLAWLALLGLPCLGLAWLVSQLCFLASNNIHQNFKDLLANIGCCFGIYPLSGQGAKVLYLSAGPQGCP